MGRTGIYACGESVSRRNSLESVALFSLKQEAPASIGGSTFTWGGFLAGTLIGSSTHSVYYDDEVIPLTYDGVQFLGAQRLLLTKGDKNMLINQETGAFVAEFPASVKWMAFLLDDYTWCWNDKKEYAIVDRNGQVQYRVAAGQIQDVKGFRNGLTPVKTKTGWGIMDHQGQWIVEPQYKDITMV